MDDNLDQLPNKRIKNKSYEHRCLFPSADACAMRFSPIKIKNRRDVSTFFNISYKEFRT